MGNAASIGRAIRKEISRTIGSTMTLAVANLRAATPVDTGHARSNWILTVRGPYIGVDGSRTAVSYAAQDRGLALMTSFDVGRTPIVWLRNNVPYVPYLDEGWSSQAGPNFVADAINAAANGAPYGKKGAVRKMLKGMARAAIIRRRGGTRTNAVVANNARHGR